MKEYRIIKNRRPIGQRFLLQEGEWTQRTSNLTGRTRRVFRYVWEKEFRTRREAAAYRDSLVKQVADSDGYIDLSDAYAAQHEAWAGDHDGAAGESEPAQAALAERIANHPMYSPSDLKYLRDKGYTDAEILAFWDRDHGMGHQPVEHRLTYAGTASEILRDVLKDNLSPEAVAAVVSYLQPVSTRSSAVNKEIEWFAEQLVELLGGHQQHSRLANELGL